MFDVAILGSGPAAWALAAALSDSDRSIALIGPAPLTPWQHNYGGWEDQLDASVSNLLGVPIGDVIAQRWSPVCVLGERKAITGRTYARFDNVRLLTALAGRASANLEVVDATVTDVEVGEESTVIRRSKGKPIVRARPCQDDLTV